ncbi:A24 family peptidase [Vibrio salinus]|uniref:A24 family peptidase n=1 Tax=Vibrio salinus TaxID=2899784 RepID=UPI001E5F456F|nr:prepilin peptidase [Vibrio salinus]MCE0495916.1 prepilin peptidase [Vibrio salinus]
MHDQWILYMLVLPLLYVSISDLFYRKIYNHLIYLLLVMVLVNVFLFYLDMGSYAGLTVRQIQSQFELSVLGAVAVLIIGFALFAIGQMGAGDVKLMAVLCLLLGGENLVTFLLLTALAGGVLVFFMPFVRVIEFRGAKWILNISAWFPFLKIPVPDAAYTNSPTTTGLPYGIAISIGAVLSLLTPLTH